MTKQQLKCIKILKKYDELTSEELFKKMKLQLKFDTSSYYGTLSDELNFIGDEAFGRMIVVSHIDQKNDPLSNDSVFKLSKKGHDFLGNKKLQMREKGYNWSTWVIAFSSMVIALVGLLLSMYAMEMFN